MNSLNPNIAIEKNYWSFYHTRLSLLAVISRAATVVVTDHLQQSSEEKKTV